MQIYEKLGGKKVRLIKNMQIYKSLSGKKKY